MPIRFLGNSLDSNEYLVQDLRNTFRIFYARTVKLNEASLVASIFNLSTIKQEELTKDLDEVFTEGQTKFDHGVSKTALNEVVIDEVINESDIDLEKYPNLNKTNSNEEREPYNFRPRKTKIFAALCRLHQCLLSNPCYAFLQYRGKLNHKEYISFKEALLSGKQTEWRVAYEDEIEKLEFLMDSKLYNVLLLVKFYLFLR